MLVLLGSCGGGGGSGGTTFTSGSGNTYATTSTRGDYAEWTLSGSTLNATWQVIDGIGQTDYTFSITASCDPADSFNLRNCTISTSSCTDGVSACPADPTGELEIMDAPGVALFVNTDPGMISSQLHVGFAKNNNACTEDISGDYTYIRNGLGVNENFGMYRISALNELNILHSDFGFDAPDAVTTPNIIYRTGIESEFFTDQGCSNGVRSRGAGGSSLRLMATSSGLFVLDLPAGQGGLLSYKTSSAASLVDFAGKSFTGITFPDNGAPEAIRAVFSASVTTVIGLNVTFPVSPPNSHRLMRIGTADTQLAPLYPDFMTAPTVATDYGASLLAATYPTPADFPGLFKIDQLDDSGRIVIAAMKSGGKVIGVGMVYNYRDGGDTNPSTGAPFNPAGLYNTGNFIIFEE